MIEFAIAFAWLILGFGCIAMVLLYWLLGSVSEALSAAKWTMVVFAVVCGILLACYGWFQLGKWIGVI